MQKGRQADANLSTEAPNPNITVVRTGNDLVFAEGKTSNSTTMPDERSYASSFLASPDFDCTIMATTDQPKLVTGNRPHAFDMTEKCLRGFAGLKVPYLDSVIEATGNKNRLRTLDHGFTSMLIGGGGSNFFAFVVRGVLSMDDHS